MSIALRYTSEFSKKRKIVYLNMGVRKLNPKDPGSNWKAQDVQEVG
jgi:hypothetical protein